MKWRRVDWRSLMVLGVALVLTTVVVFIVDTTRTFRISQDRQIELLTTLHARVQSLETQNKDLTSEAEKAKAQANTSVDQLVNEGIDPIVASPEVIDVATTPQPTTTTRLSPPPTIPPPPTTPTTNPSTTSSTTEPPPTTPPPTEPPTTTPPTTPPPTEPSTTTTLEQP